MYNLIFHGFDGKDYDAKIIGTRNGHTIIQYEVRVKFEKQIITAYLTDDQDRERLTEKTSLPAVEQITFEVAPAPLPPFTLDGGCDTFKKSFQGRLF